MNLILKNPAVGNSDLTVATFIFSMQVHVKGYHTELNCDWETVVNTTTHPEKYPTPIRSHIYIKTTHFPI